MVPASLEVIDQRTIAAVEASAYAAGLPTDAGAMFVELEGKGTDGEPRNVYLVHGPDDYDDVESMRAAFAGADRLLLVSGTEIGRRVAQHRRAIDVAGAITASTLTTIAVFVPVLFVQETSGQLFRDIAVAIAVAVTTFGIGHGAAFGDESGHRLLAHDVLAEHLEEEAVRAAFDLPGQPWPAAPGAG